MDRHHPVTRSSLELRPSGQHAFLRGGQSKGHHCWCCFYPDRLQEQKQGKPLDWFKRVPNTTYRGHKHICCAPQRSVWSAYMGSAIRSTAEGLRQSPDRCKGCGKLERMPHAPSDTYMTQRPVTNSWTRKTSSQQQK